MSIPALTVWEPWATLLAENTKWIETRAWQTPYRGPLLIHAGSNTSCLAEAARFGLDPARCEANLGAIIAVGNLIGILPVEEAARAHPEQVIYGDFTPGRFAWVFGSIDRLRQPIPARGMPGLWTPAPTVNLESVYAIPG